MSAKQKRQTMGAEKTTYVQSIVVETKVKKYNRKGFNVFRNYQGELILISPRHYKNLTNILGIRFDTLIDIIEKTKKEQHRYRECQADIKELIERNKELVERNIRLAHRNKKTETLYRELDQQRDECLIALSKSGETLKKIASMPLIERIRFLFKRTHIQSLMQDVAAGNGK